MHLSSSGLRAVREFLIRTARPLERALFYYRFENGPTEAILDALASFLNPDGGFGRALEPDLDRKSTRLTSSHESHSRMPSSA